MEITSFYFALLSVVSIFVFYFLKPKFRILFPTILSCAFAASYSYLLVAYVFVYSLINYMLGLKIAGSNNRKAFFRAGIVLNLLQLVLLRYASFTVDPVFSFFGVDVGISRLSEFIIPVGISFFTLQGIGYLINIQLGWEKPERNFLHFFLYIIFYPRFLSGPVDRSNSFLPQLNKLQAFNNQDVTEGLRQALFGFFKKIAIANQLAPFVITANSDINSLNGFSVLVLLLIQPLYLYFDFSGYSDIAIGFARTLGIRLRPNFERPFMSENMTSFWKRFHMSLSSWFHDYIFIRASYRYRKWGVRASIFAIMLTWILFGIWHGAGWTFMLLGVLQGLAIIYEFYTKKWRTRLFSGMPGTFRKWTGRILTYLFYCLTLVFFFSPDLTSVVSFFSKLGNMRGSLSDMIRPDIFIMTITFIGFFMIFEILKNDHNTLFITLEGKFLNKRISGRVFRWTFYFGMMAVIFVLSNNVQQFIYFQF